LVQFIKSIREEAAAIFDQAKTIPIQK